jgi:HSP20 family protein
MERRMPEPFERSVSRLRRNVHAALDRWVHRREPDTMQRSDTLPVRSSEAVGRLRRNIHEALSRWLPRRKSSGNGKEELPSAFDGVDPPISLEETDDEVVVVAEMPGFDEKDFSVEVMDDRLILRGSNKQETEERGRNFYYAERSFGSFTRVLPLPCEINVTSASARYKNGLLRVVLPKAEHAKAKRIQVRSA